MKEGMRVSGGRSGIAVDLTSQNSNRKLEKLKKNKMREQQRGDEEKDMDSEL